MIAAFAENKASSDDGGGETLVAKEPATLPNCEQPSEAEGESDTEQKGFLLRASRLRTKMSSVEDLCSPLTPDGAQKKSVRRSKETTATSETSNSSRSLQVVPPSGSLRPAQNSFETNLKSSPVADVTIKSIPMEQNKKWRMVHTACHSVLAVLRADPRYVNPARFTEELTVSEVYGHSLHLGLQELLLKLQQTEPRENNPTFYLDVFCEAVQQNDISAAVTGACLSVLHKFLEYGYTDGIEKITESLIHCAFEESDPHDDGAILGRRRLSTTGPSTRGLNRATSQYFQQETLYYDNDEQVVHRLLALCVLTVKIAFKADEGVSVNIEGLLNTCLHVRFASTASALLKHAAASACHEIVLDLFGTKSMTEAKCIVVEKLASSLHSEDAMSDTAQEVVANHALQLAIIALERTHDEPKDNEIKAWGALTKGVLELATSTTECIALSLCCRVLYLLLDVNHLNHLKCEFEVFLQSVHIRRLKSSTSDEEKEVVLESILELCYGTRNTAPINATELYLNYDCDGACTNLFESVVQALGKSACPFDLSIEAGETGQDTATATMAPANSTLSGTSPKEKILSDNGSKTDAQPINTGSIKPLQTVTAHAQVNHLNRLALEGILSILDDIAHSCFDGVGASASSTSTVTTESSTIADVSDFDKLHCSPKTIPVTEDELCERKLKKRSLAEVVDAFNTGNPDKGEWLQLAVAKGLLSSPDDSKAVAKLLYTGNGFDKRRMGIYLSRGPVKNFPFHASIRSDFAGNHDFTELSFAVALRKFLSKFRLPGEAQCIDRLMEAFSKELYSQQGETTFFKNSDAVYVLAFSTIMLNTDLHNPTIKTDKRMTKEQFVRNNRGINGGEDIPEDFLSDLYDHIKSNELQVRQEAGEIMKQTSKGDSKLIWNAISAKKKEIEPPVCLSSVPETKCTGMLDRDMFVILTNSCLKAIIGIFTRSWDDALVVRTLRGLQQIVKVAAFFDLNHLVNEVLQVLLEQGRSYIKNSMTLDEPAGMEGGASVGTPTITRNTSTESTVCEDETTFGGDTDHQLIPFGLLCSSQDRGEVDVTGSASNRGLLALDSSFILLRKNSERIKEAWPVFIECLSALRDCRALPQGLSDLDDFADSNGNVLPLSSFAKASQKRFDEYQRSLSDRDSNKNKGWFRAFFRKGKADDQDEVIDADEEAVIAPKPELSVYAKTLLNVAESARVDDIIQRGSSQLPEETIHKLLNKLDAFPFEDDPVGEQHAVFSLELAARALLSNRSRSAELFLLFLTKFESILCKVKEDRVPAPFVVERIVVTILRSSIHLYELPELRAHLRSSLQLILMTLPRNFIRVISDRMACGLAIILRASFHFFETPNEWTFMGDTLDLLANYSSSRVFVFDGIASTVEYALPNPEIRSDTNRSDIENEKTENRPQLSAEACTVLSRILTRFVLGFYQGDVSLTVPSMLCLEKVYRHKVALLYEKQTNKTGSEALPAVSISDVPDKDLWQNVTVAVYSVCRSTDPEASRDGMECFRRIVLRTAVDQISDEKWIAILYLMVSKQPPTAAEASRGNTFAILGHLLAKVLPGMSYSEENREDLEDLVKQTAALAEENLRQSRRGFLFEKTVQTLTFISNQLISDEFGGNKDFNIWANETFLEELDRVGDVGGKPTTTTNAVEDEDVSEISDSVAEDDAGPIVEVPDH